MHQGNGVFAPLTHFRPTFTPILKPKPVMEEEQPVEAGSEENDSQKAL